MEFSLLPKECTKVGTCIYDLVFVMEAVTLETNVQGLFFTSKGNLSWKLNQRLKG